MAILKGFPPSNTISVGTYFPVTEHWYEGRRYNIDVSQLKKRDLSGNHSNRNRWIKRRYAKANTIVISTMTVMDRLGHLVPKLYNEVLDVWFVAYAFDLAGDANYDRLSKVVQKHWEAYKSTTHVVSDYDVTLGAEYCIAHGLFEMDREACASYLRSHVLASRYTAWHTWMCHILGVQ